MKWAALAVRARLQKKRFEHWRSVLLQKSHPLFPPWLSIVSHTGKVDVGQINKAIVTTETDMVRAIRASRFGGGRQYFDRRWEYCTEGTKLIFVW